MVGRLMFLIVLLVCVLFSSVSSKKDLSTSKVTKASIKSKTKQKIQSKSSFSKKLSNKKKKKLIATDDDDDGDDDNNSNNDGENDDDDYNDDMSSLDIVKPYNDNDDYDSGSTDSSSNSLVKSTFDITKKLAFGIGKAGKSIVKTSIDMCVAKHVTMEQVYGKWLIRQEVEIRKGIHVSCPATIHFKEDEGVVSTMFEGVEYKSKFTFKERRWPLKCTIKFEAKAFQEAEGTEPVKLLYKGYFKGSLTNPRLVLMRGKIYRMSGKMFKKQVRVGEFKGIKRRYN